MSGIVIGPDLSRRPHPDPCPDCGRVYLNGENVTLHVPTVEGSTRIAWSGCVDCWVRRTRPFSGVQS